MLRARIRPLEGPAGGSNATRSGGGGHADGEQRAGAPAASWWCVPTGWSAVDGALGGGLIRGAIHDLVGPEGEPWIAPHAMLVHLVAQARSADPGRGGAVLWIGARTWPAPWVLMPRPAGGKARAPGGRDGVESRGAFGAAPGGTSGWAGCDDLVDEMRAEGCRPADAALLHDSLLVDAPDAQGRSSAAEIALEIGDVAALVIDGEGFDLTASRRLQLAGERRRRAGDAPLIVLARPEREASRPLSSASRWVVRRMAGGPGRSGAPAWCLTRVRCRPPQPDRSIRVSDRPGMHGAEARRWILEWDDASDSVALVAALAD